MLQALRGYIDDVTDDLERAYPDFSDAITRVVVDRGELTLIGDTKLGPNREAIIKEVELAAMNAKPTIQMTGLLAK
jgi:hypothetical protein